MTAQQKIGEKYYDDLLKRVPREEITRVSKAIRIPRGAGWECVVAGSYRKGARDSKDIDIVFVKGAGTGTGTGEGGVADEDLAQIKRVIGKVMPILATVSEGNDRGMYIVQGIDKIVRHLDVRLVEEKYKVAYLFSFTYGAEYNRRARGIAKSRGYKLNEYGLENLETGRMKMFKNEGEIVKFLGLPPLPRG